MTFVSVPNTGQSLGGTRDQIRTNMDDLRSNDAVNHYDTNDVLNRGKHKYSLYVAQGSDPTTLAGEGVIFTKAVSAQTIPYYSKDTIGTDYPVVPIRAMVRCNGSGTITASFNITSVVRNTGTNFTFTFTEAMPNTNYIIMVTGGYNNEQSVPRSVTYATGDCVVNFSSNIDVSALINAIFLHF